MRRILVDHGGALNREGETSFPSDLVTLPPDTDLLAFMMTAQ
jgi:hypothetical protein